MPLFWENVEERMLLHLRWYLMVKIQRVWQSSSCLANKVRSAPSRLNVMRHSVSLRNTIWDTCQGLAAAGRRHFGNSEMTSVFLSGFGLFHSDRNRFLDRGWNRILLLCASWALFDYFGLGLLVTLFFVLSGDQVRIC